MFFDQTELSGLQWKDFFEKIDANHEGKSPSPTALRPNLSVATLPYTKSICYGECPTEETQNLVLIKCSICDKLIKDIGYAYHMRARHGQRPESPGASLSGDDMQDFLLSPPHLPMTPSTSYSPLKNIKIESPPLSPRTLDMSNRIRSPPYYVEQRNDLVLRLTKRIPSRASMEESSAKPLTKMEECEVIVEPDAHLPPLGPRKRGGRRKGARGRRRRVAPVDSTNANTTNFGFETELEESPLKNVALRSYKEKQENYNGENPVGFEVENSHAGSTSHEVIKQGVASKSLRGRRFFPVEKLQEKIPVSLCSPTAEFSNSSSAISMESPMTPATIRSLSSSNGKLSKSEVAKRSPVVESAKTSIVEHIANSKTRSTKGTSINRNLKFDGERQKGQHQKPTEAMNKIKTTAPQTELEIVQKLLGIPGMSVTVSPAKLVGSEKRLSTEIPSKVETFTKEESPMPIETNKNKKIIMSKLQIMRNQMAQKQQFLPTKTGYTRLHETTNAAKTPSPSEQSTVSEDGSSSSSIEGVEIFDAKAECDLMLSNSGSIRTLISDPMRKNFKQTPNVRPVSAVRPIVQLKMEAPNEQGTRKTIKVTPFFRRGPSSTTIRLPRHLLGSSGSSHEFRKLLSETAKAEMAQPLNLNPYSVGIKRIRRPLLHPLARPVSDQPSVQHPSIPTRILKGIKVTTTPSVTNPPTDTSSSIDFKFPSALRNTPEPEPQTSTENGWQSASNQHFVSIPSAPGITVSVNVSDVPGSPSSSTNASTHQPKIIPLSRCSTPTQQQQSSLPSSRRVSRESTPGYIEGVPLSQRMNGMVYQNYAQKYDDSTSINGIELDRGKYQQGVQRRINAELAEQLHQQKMMLRAAQASGQILPYQIHDSSPSDSFEPIDNSYDNDLPPEIERIPTLVDQQQDPRAYLKRPIESVYMNEDPNFTYQNNKKIRMGMTKSSSMRSMNREYDSGQFDYRPPFRRVVRATRPHRQNPMFPTSMGHHNYASAPITPSELDQNFYNLNSGFSGAEQMNEYANETAYMETQQQHVIPIPNQRIPVYRPVVHKRIQQGMVPTDGVNQQQPPQTRLPGDYRYIDMHGMEFQQPNSSQQQAIFIAPTAAAAQQSHLVPIANVSRRPVQIGQNVQQQQHHQPLMYIQPKPSGNLHQPVLFQINPCMRNQAPASFQLQPIEPPPVLQAEVCLPSELQTSRSNQNIYTYNQQQYYPQPQVSRQPQGLPHLLPRRQVSHNGNYIHGAPGSFQAGMQPAQFLVVSPASMQTPVLDMPSIPNITPHS